MISFSTKPFLVTCFALLFLASGKSLGDDVDLTLSQRKGELLYNNPFSKKSDVSAWIMEGPGELSFDEGWMRMYSPDEKMHHVFWCPEDFPNSFVAEWEAQNLNTEAGLVIVFFAAMGLHGEDIFAEQLLKRDGTFDQYTLGQIRSYHISYYANAVHNKDRGHANLRKNNLFQLVQEGAVGIPTLSKDVHKIVLYKIDARVVMYIDGRLIIDWTDDGKTWGPVWDSGKIGFRQMQWTQFRYRNFKVWAIK